MFHSRIIRVIATAICLYLCSEVAVSLLHERHATEPQAVAVRATVATSHCTPPHDHSELPDPELHGEVVAAQIDSLRQDDTEVQRDRGANKLIEYAAATPIDRDWNCDLSYDYDVLARAHPPGVLGQSPELDHLLLEYFAKANPGWFPQKAVFGVPLDRADAKWNLARSGIRVYRIWEAGHVIQIPDVRQFLEHFVENCCHASPGGRISKQDVLRLVQTIDKNLDLAVSEQQRYYIAWHDSGWFIIDAWSRTTTKLGSTSSDPRASISQHNIVVRAIAGTLDFLLSRYGSDSPIFKSATRAIAGVFYVDLKSGYNEIQPPGQVRALDLRLMARELGLELRQLSYAWYQVPAWPANGIVEPTLAQLPSNNIFEPRYIDLLEREAAARLLISPIERSLLPELLIGSGPVLPRLLLKMLRL